VKIHMRKMETKKVASAILIIHVSEKTSY